MYQEHNSFLVRVQSPVLETRDAGCEFCLLRVVSCFALVLLFIFSSSSPSTACPSPQIILPPPSFPPQPQPPTTYNGSYQADGSQVHGRQGPAQAARHQGCSQVGARHRCVFSFRCLNELSLPSAPLYVSRNGPVLSAGAKSGSESTRLAKERGEVTAGSDRASAAKTKSGEIREQGLKR